MKYYILILLLFKSILCSAQPFIHVHNDYQKPEPLTNALRNKAWSIEADIYLSENKLLVAHDKKELPTAKTLDSLYLQPIINLFKRHKGTISEDSSYAPTLMIDIKENGEAVLAELIKLLSPHRSVFDRSVNSKAVQVVISGDRGPSFKWVSYPSFILFDGRPTENYDEAKLARIAFISDSWIRYALPPVMDDYDRVKEVIEKVHGLRKPIRFWATPDNAEFWELQKKLGVDIINTDKVVECREYFIKK